MITCGLKLTHDGAIALIDDGALAFSVEVEKLDNNKRYSMVAELSIIPQLLDQYGYDVGAVDRWVIDGWDGHSHGEVQTHYLGEPVVLRTAAYRENDLVPNLLTPGHSAVVEYFSAMSSYVSYAHVAGHLASAFCTNPFVTVGQPSLGLVWDGGTFPRLYYIDPGGCVQNGGALFPLTGHVYATAAHHFGPYRRADAAQSVDDLSVAGKLMAYIALGKPQPAVIEVIHRCFERHFDGSGDQAKQFRNLIGGWGSHAETSVSYLHAFFENLRRELDGGDFSDEDVLASIHTFLEALLIERIERRIIDWKGVGPWHLSFAGGCALNIKWNTALRKSWVLSSVWVPPFPNDSGSAIGAAGLDYSAVVSSGLVPISWNVRSGPEMAADQPPPPGWRARSCSIADVAWVLHDTGQPVIVLDGRAELGPRALGGRSIFAPASDAGMKLHLNEIKDREQYRPVAPICLEEHAPEIFDPGTPDPYMLFEHELRPTWAHRVPAIAHLDGTARLQTVGPNDDPVIRQLLRSYFEVSGLPLLCNTSANYNGSGFFPDVASAARWGRVRAIWSAGSLYERVDA